MYTDYDVIYESNINEFLIPMLIGMGIILIVAIISLIAMMRIFKKANRSGIAALVPVYNIIVMFEIVNRPIWQILLLFVPILNVVIYFDVLYKIAKSFRKTNAFALCTVFFPFIFLPILGFSDSEYMGINKEAMTGNSVAIGIPRMNENEQDNSPIVEKKEAPLADISIGGGVYQKDYEESLLKVPETETKDETSVSLDVSDTSVSTPKIPEIDLLGSLSPVNEEPLTNLSNITPVQTEKTGMDLFNNIDFIETVPNEVRASEINIPQMNITEEATTQMDVPEIVSVPELMETPNQNINSIETSTQEINAIVDTPEPIVNSVLENLEDNTTQTTASEILTSQMDVSQVVPIAEVVQNTVETSIPIIGSPVEKKEIKLSSNMNEADYVNCANCGAVVKKSAGRCFMCGKEL